jgi:hypothetical protein
MSKAKPVHGTPRLNTPDLIFKMIEDHKKVAAEYEAICRDVVPGTCVPDPEKEFEISAIEAEARHELACTSATSLTGLLAVLNYVGKFTDAGVPNSAFDQDDLMNVIISARDTVRDQLACSRCAPETLAEMAGVFDKNDADHALSDLRQMTLIAIRTTESMSEATRSRDPEAFDVLSFSLHDTLVRVGD